MPYSYENEKPFLFTEKGSVDFLRVRDAAKAITDKSGAVTAEALMSASKAATNWQQLASVDRLVELKELLEVPNPHSSAGQHRIFIPPYRS